MSGLIILLGTYGAAVLLFLYYSETNGEISLVISSKEEKLKIKGVRAI